MCRRLIFCSVGSNDIVNRVEPSRSHRSDAVGDIELAARFDRIDLNGTEVMGDRPTDGHSE